jgi:predicted neuraminidase
MMPVDNELSGFVSNGVVVTGPGKLTGALSPAPGSGGAKNIWFAVSADNGASWSKPTISGLNNPGGSVALLRLENGHLVASFNDHPLWLTPLTVAVSTDGGQSWPYRRNIETGQWDNRDPCLLQTRDGSIHLVYVSRNIHLKHVTFSESWVMENE